MMVDYKWPNNKRVRLNSFAKTIDTSITLFITLTKG
jgi:hypothetical protein